MAENVIQALKEALNYESLSAMVKYSNKVSDSIKSFIKSTTAESVNDLLKALSESLFSAVRKEKLINLREAIAAQAAIEIKKTAGTKVDVLLNGSARQTRFLDYIHTVNHDNGSALSFMSPFAHKLGAKYHPFLLPDVIFQQRLGTEYKRELNISTASRILIEKDRVREINDPSKIKLLYAQMMVLANERMTQTSYTSDAFKFYDDRSDILGKLWLIFHDNPHAIPKGTTMYLHHVLSGKVIKSFKPIVGQGDNVSYEKLKQAMEAFYERYSKMLASLNRCYRRLHSIVSFNGEHPHLSKEQQSDFRDKVYMFFEQYEKIYAVVDTLDLPAGKAFDALFTVLDAFNHYVFLLHFYWDAGPIEGFQKSYKESYEAVKQVLKSFPRTLKDSPSPFLFDSSCLSELDEFLNQAMKKLEDPSPQSLAQVGLFGEVDKRQRSPEVSAVAATPGIGLRKR